MLNVDNIKCYQYINIINNDIFASTQLILIKKDIKL